MTPADAPPAPRVGLGVIVRRGEELLLGLRHGSLGEGEWAVPGGHLEHGESLEGCAVREVEEETGLRLDASAVAFAALENAIFPTGQHYVVVFMMVDAPCGVEPQVLEPDKCKAWRWVRWDALPQPLFQPLRQLVGRGWAPPRE